jgi:hypothetical protein
MKGIRARLGHPEGRARVGIDRCTDCPEEARVGEGDSAPPCASCGREIACVVSVREVVVEAPGATREVSGEGWRAWKGADRRRGHRPAPLTGEQPQARLSAPLALPVPERYRELVRLYREGLHDGPPPSPHPTPAERGSRFAAYEPEPRFAKDARRPAAGPCRVPGAGAPARRRGLPVDPRCGTP